jgi:Domain of unknown function (DUF4157)
MLDLPQKSPPPGCVMPGILQRKCACGGTLGPTGECEARRKKREAGFLQRKAAHSSSTIPHLPDVAPAVRDTLRLSGQPLDPAARAALEPRFGYDFSGVRIHTDATAAQSASDVSALAYTVGRDVVFGAGQYSPSTASGRTLLAHELAHVIQQRGTAFDPGAPLYLDAPDSALEREAEAAAHGINRSTAHAGDGRAAGLVQRATDTSGAAKPKPENECAGWFADYESLSKRAAEHYVRTELGGQHGAVKKIECDMFASNGAFACTVWFADGTPIRVIARPDSIVVGKFPLKTMTPPADQPLCWYAFKCPEPNRDLVLTKIRCQTATKPSTPPAASASKDLVG